MGRNSVSSKEGQFSVDEWRGSLNGDDYASVHAIGNAIWRGDEWLALAPASSLYLSGRNAFLDQERRSTLRPPHGQSVIERLRAGQIGVTDHHELRRRPGS